MKGTRRGRDTAARIELIRGEEIEASGEKGRTAPIDTLDQVLMAINAVQDASDSNIMESRYLGNMHIDLSDRLNAEVKGVAVNVAKHDTSKIMEKIYEGFRVDDEEYQNKINKSLRIAIKNVNYQIGEDRLVAKIVEELNKKNQTIF